MNISEETIDSFLRGDLSGAELEAFNGALTADPKLQQEVAIQGDIVDSLKKHRHQQLKNRLNAIEMKPVATGFFSSAYVKLIASIGIVALLVISGVSIFNNTHTTSDVSDNAVENTSVIAKSVKPNTTTENKTPSNEKASISAATADKTESIKSTNSTPVKSITKAGNSSKKSTTYTEPSDKDMEEDYSIDKVNDDFSMPAGNDGHSTISVPQVKVSIVKEKNLGYRFFNNQLFLHGNFSNSTYELYELNNKPSKQLFLYFENNYYELIQGKTKVTSLSPITDKATLLQLTQLREH